MKIKLTMVTFVTMISLKGMASFHDLDVREKITSTSDAGKWLIRRFESFRANRYQDGNGNWTIGYGHHIISVPVSDGPDEPDPVLVKLHINPFKTITKEQGTAILVEDIIQRAPVRRWTKDIPLFQHEYDALTSFCFNIGGGRFRNPEKCGILPALENKKYKMAGKMLLDWMKEDGKLSRGLVKRRCAEMMVFFDKKLDYRLSMAPTSVFKIDLPRLDEFWAEFLDEELRAEAVGIYEGYSARAN